MILIPCARQTKETIILLFVIILEEDGEVHVHSTRKLVHTRTITLHYCSTKMNTVENFHNLFNQEEISWCENFTLVPLLILRGGFP